jgi:hypothetical protein
MRSLSEERMAAKFLTNRHARRSIDKQKAALKSSVPNCAGMGHSSQSGRLGPDEWRR